MKAIRILLTVGVLFITQNLVSQKVNKGYVKVNYLNGQQEVVDSEIVPYHTEVRKSNVTQNGDLTEVVFYDGNGNITERGYFKNGRLHGMWQKFNGNGEQIQIAHYHNGKKHGKWFFWSSDGSVLKEMDYQNNELKEVQEWEITEGINVANG